MLRGQNRWRENSRVKERSRPVPSLNARTSGNGVDHRKTSSRDIARISVTFFLVSGFYLPNQDHRRVPIVAKMKLECFIAGFHGRWPKNERGQGRGTEKERGRIRILVAADATVF
ncbi:hypothetical protein JCGZ_18438 [Jatropha curcas]|uniref:Uncharacterized protein n=1 Tax=Jatropha curcas TaxID=180498 RepID=A0A067K497_JATCU|nr:hypothetical protein JCGZ_18438 [Jatropha curcas]